MTELTAVGRISANGIIEIAQTLDQYEAEVASNSCAWCKGALTMRHHPHPGGVLVVHHGRTTRQWIYGQCQQCEYQWALWKLRREQA
jgi:3',5'-cyclic AMP phosphodiesterase CpdA